MPAEHLGITGMTPQTVDRSVVSHSDIHLKPIGELSAKTDSTNQPIRPREVSPTVRKGWHSDSWKTDLCPMTSSPRKTLNPSGIYSFTVQEASLHRLNDPWFRKVCNKVCLVSTCIQFISIPVILTIFTFSRLPVSAF